jgi:hypothetical protein
MEVELDPIILPLLVSGSLPPDRVSVFLEDFFAMKRFQRCEGGKPILAVLYGITNV